jgi:hypothetical protein
VTRRTRSLIAYPTIRPKIVAEDAWTLSRAVPYLSLSRRGTTAQRLARVALASPGGHLLLTRIDYAPPCGWGLVDSATAAVVAGDTALKWAFLPSPWGKHRLRGLGFDESGRARATLLLDAEGGAESVIEADEWDSFRAPAQRLVSVHGRWSVWRGDLLPPYHRPAPWKPEHLALVVDEIALRLASKLGRPLACPADLTPSHGDFVPWNVRVSRRRLWVFDWEDVGWAPPRADLVRFAVAHRSLRRPGRSGDPVAVRQMLKGVLGAPELRRGAEHWLAHRNLAYSPGSAGPPATDSDARRSLRERRLLEALAEA